MPLRRMTISRELECGLSRRLRRANQTTTWTRKGAVKNISIISLLLAPLDQDGPPQCFQCPVRRPSVAAGRGPWSSPLVGSRVHYTALRSKGPTKAPRNAAGCRALWACFGRPGRGLPRISLLRDVLWFNTDTVIASQSHLYLSARKTFSFWTEKAARLPW